VRFVQTKARVVTTSSGAPAALTCKLCDTRHVACVALGDEGLPACMKCVRAALVEIAAASCESAVIATDFDGNEQTTRIGGAS
jgi:hypothetical protein